MSAGDASTAERYAWARDWIGDDGSSFAMAHTGVVITGDGAVITGDASRPWLVTSDGFGRRSTAVPIADATELHGLTLVEDDGVELVWVADTAVKVFGGDRELRFHRGAPRGRVFQIGLDGEPKRTLDPPELAVYESTDYSPTSVAVDEERFGGSGDIWVADGYGASLVHRYDREGRYLASLSGEEGAGRFDEPHDVFIDRRGSAAELLVTDRTNHRIQVYDLDGRFERVVGKDFLRGPTQMAVSGDELVVTDILAGRLTFIDREGRLVAHLFGHPSPPAGWDDLPDDWPNRRGPDGLLQAVSLQREVFHAPHGLAVAEDGTIYVSEFAIGGRTAVLVPLDT